MPTLGTRFLPFTLSLSLSLLGLRDGQVPRAPCPPNVLLGEGEVSNEHRSSFG